VVEEWALGCEDEQARAYVTMDGLRIWRNHDRRRFYHAIDTWLKDPRLRIRHLGLLALLGRASDSDFVELPDVLKLLEGVSAHVRGSSQRTLLTLIRSLAQISPPEVAKYLIDQNNRQIEGAHRLAQNSAAVFPERLRHEIRAALG
jgi:hypothetical protein